MVLLLSLISRLYLSSNSEMFVRASVNFRKLSHWMGLYPTVRSEGLITGLYTILSRPRLIIEILNFRVFFVSAFVA